MDADLEAIAGDVEALKTALLTAWRDARADRAVAAAEMAVAKARASEDQALIARQALRIAKLERQIYGQRSERSIRLIGQMELTFEELEASTTEDELAAEMAVAGASTVAAFTRKRPAHRDTFPEHLPRERVMVVGPSACGCCGGTRLRKLGEDVTRTLEVVPRSWKVIETVREKFTCRDCEKISQAPAPFHVIPRGWAGPSLLAMILFEKFGQHQPLNRQVERYALEGVPIGLSTAADAVGAGCAVLEPLLRLVEAHVMAAERLHGDDTTVPVLALGKCDVAAMLDLCARRQALSRSGAAGGDVLLLARSRRRASPEASGGLRRDPAGRRLRRLRQALRSGAETGAGQGGGVLGPCAAGRSSPWPIWKRTPGAGRPARRRSSSRPWRSRSCAGSTPCSRSSGPSTATPPRRARRSAKT